MNNIQATQNKGDSCGVYPSSAFMMVHHQPAAIPGEEGPNGERETGESDSEAFGNALLDPQVDGLVEDCRVPLDDPFLCSEGVNGLDGAECLLHQGVCLGVLAARLAGEVQKVLPVDETRDYEEQDQRVGNQSQPPGEIGGEGEPGDEDRGVHQKQRNLFKVKESRKTVTSAVISFHIPDLLVLIVPFPKLFLARMCFQN